MANLKLMMIIIGGSLARDLLPGVIMIHGTVLPVPGSTVTRRGPRSD